MNLKAVFQKMENAGERNNKKQVSWVEANEMFINYTTESK
jgi:hypothetical protein